ncbi:MAG: FosX/FosE/FosI family fosfomycin resistance thiol transferase [Methylocystis sp.]|nr:FosX/FosE/FosI family fosfomycin resistance thiol transferase [Methylocystis sp.]MCA3582571.1 FosX/FosE/FosI family fosfomycin resistance thiol transferase [Methylocystis sp.]MCA3586838.1 FosX/FosE/FosI family fosfomycin resistance thiol transferase [Methylocystis sp.]MCA3591756.1 FosX/FosE/FosI family fosfomycin resistance thiol transferase [Methylocystis sp.]
MAEGLSHLTFIVRDLDRMERLLVDVFGARKIYDSGAATFSIAPERFFLVGDGSGDPSTPAPVWIATMEGEPLSNRTYNHVAFKITEAEYESRLAAIQSLGLDVRESRPRVEGEGRSIYFHDYDNHLFELHTGTLAERLQRYATER